MHIVDPYPLEPGGQPQRDVPEPTSATVEEQSEHILRCT